ncbi:helix-turn-helix domain-containing protein [Bradyrhizobium commune]|uniref:Helix-turn-helix transcriptional regulator n=1 Tax=Bradyrhizobium commune TaxID=83627 RepID=A0A7S9GWB6_9BRAD|nr:AraC family transcriptional regulator [Bradyrhizobium commune]QPF88635.1 helix-turn-helix transcriptional regulator [Bradyrhizobium commune]
MMPILDDRSRAHSLDRFAINQQMAPRGLPGRNSRNGAEGGAIASMVPARGGLAPSVVRRIRDYIEGHIGQRITVKLLAKLANLSVCYFVRAFKRSLGVTPHDYLIRRRVELTMALLSGTAMALSEIAAAAGFADQSHCARRFRQHVGMSPCDYRRSRKLSVE